MTANQVGATTLVASSACRPFGGQYIASPAPCCLIGMVDHIVALIPLDEYSGLAEFPPFREAQAACDAAAGPDTLDPSEAQVVKDEETKCEAIELYGEAATMEIPCKCELPYLVVQIKDVERFVSFTVTVVDHERRIRRLTVSNKQSMARVKAFECSMPLVLKPGWNYVCLDLADLTHKAFGTQYQRTKNVQLNANCRILRVYFQDRLYEDVELPEFLRVIK